LKHSKVEKLRNIDFVNSRAKPKIYGYETVISLLLPVIQKSPSFGKSYSIRNILARLIQKSPSFGKSYSTRNILPRLIQISPSFGKSYSTRNILPRLIQKSPSLVNPTVLGIFYQD
jgi:hypothetical protein